jgi:3-hydroxyacyl-[acyl-carrier-protein] dehydratase
MRFHLIDRVEEFVPGKSLRCFKNLTMGEEYLADHFPTFPVMPGVLMLQTLVEAGSWLIRGSEGFKHSLITLREVRNVKYGSFMEPGRRMTVTVELVERGEATATLKGKGEADGQQTVSAKLVLSTTNLRDRDPNLARTDERLVDQLRGHWAQLLRTVC